MVVPVIFFIFMLFLLMLFAAKERVRVPYNRMQDTDKEELGKLIADSCRQMQIRDNGRGVAPARLMGKINAANRMISGKIRRNEPVSEGEKWFYENYYLVYRYVYARKDRLGDLPHINGLPRIVIIAKMLVNHSLNGLNAAKVRFVMEKIKASVNLNFAELKEFNNALNYALTEQVYILADRFLKQEKYSRAARERGFREKYLKSDVYVYHLLHTGTLTEAQREILLKNGITTRNALMNYNGITLHNALMAKTLFEGLRESHEFMPIHIGIQYLASFQILSDTIKLQDVGIETRLAYFTKLEEISRKTSVNEAYIAKKSIEYAKNEDIDISVALFDRKKYIIRYIKSGKIFRRKNEKISQKIYILSVVLVSAVAAGIIAGFFNIAAGILSFIPILFVTENFLNYLLSQFDSLDAETPKMNYKTVPYRHSVMIVVSEFISSFEQFKESLENLRRINAGNGGDNVQSALLVDVKGGESVRNGLDEELEDYLNNCRLEKGINVFIRKKVNVDGKYQGWERKRGAIMVLNKTLATRNIDDFSYIYDTNFITPAYVVLLDADNVLLPGDVLDMVNMMAHPYNARFDLLSAHSRYDLYSFKTAYSKRFLREGGVGVYPNFTGFYYKLFRRDIFCGKGIYRLNGFYNKLEEVFPSGKILSHDIIEGSVLATGSGATILEDAPSGFLSDRERRKRWQRGDIQLLPFISGRWENDDGQRCKKEIEPIYKFIMGKNILASLKEACLFVILLIGLFYDLKVLFFGLSLFAAPYFVDEIKILREIANRTLLRRLVENTMRNFRSMLEDFFTLGYYAIDNLYVAVSTLYRMIVGKKLLEWKTYYNSQNNRALYSYVKEFAPSFLVLTVLWTVLCAFYLNAVYLCGYLAVAAATYIRLYLLSNTDIGKKEFGEEEKKTLIDYADRTYRYFKFMAGDGYPIADNLQIKPYKGISKNTSPTNIGFSMLAEICAYYLGFNSLSESCYNINQILDCVNSLPKWKGNLYNWYDIRSKTPVTPFVSSVDSGNFVASLMIVEEFFRENYDGVGALKAGLAIANTNLSALYDENKNLFFLGYDGENFVGHYDLLNSESRILSTVYIALYKNPEHFRCLERDYTSIRGNGLLSWSGTMFETLMPDIFFKAPDFSTIGQTVRINAKIQKKNIRCGIWGVSESGYYSVDEELRYQYYAFGINKLALRNEQDRGIISPYSAALCVEYLPGQVYKNFQRLKKMGAFGEYGFYESVDCEGKPRLVLSYMTHHQGMLLSAITNAICGDVLRKLMLKNIKIGAVLPLYNELPPQNYFGLKNNEKHNKILKSESMYSINITNLEQYLQAGGLTDAQYSVIVNNFGGGFSRAFDIFLNRYTERYEANDGAFFMAKKEGKWYSPTFLPFKKNIENFSVRYSSKEIIHTNKIKKLTQKITLLGGLNGECRKFEAGNCEEVAFYMRVALNTFDGFRSHPTFCDMFTEAKIQKNLLILKNRSRNKDGGDLYLGVRAVGLKNPRFECNNQNFIGRNRDLASAAILDNESRECAFPSFGDVLSPCIGIKGSFGTGSNNSCQVCLMFANDEKTLVNSLNSLPDDMYSYAILSAQKWELKQITQEVLGELLYMPYSQRRLNSILNAKKSEIFMRVNGGKKLMRYSFADNELTRFKKFLSLAKELNILQIPVNFVITYKEPFPKDTENYIRGNLKAYSINNCSLIKEDDFNDDFAFMNFSGDLQRKKRKAVFAKYFKISEMNGDAEEILPRSRVAYRSGLGGFCKNKYIIDAKEPSGLPYSNVIADKNGGMIITDNGGGFFYFDNSREGKITVFDNDFVEDTPSEFIFAIRNDRTYRLNGGYGGDGRTIVEKGKTVFARTVGGLRCNIGYCMLCDGRARVIEMDFGNDTGGTTEIIYTLIPALGWGYSPAFLTFEQKNDIIKIYNLANNQFVYLRISVNSPENIIPMKEREQAPYFDYCFGGGKEKIFIIATRDFGLLNSLNRENIPLQIEKSLEYFRNISNIEIESQIKSFDILSDCLPYQILSSRINGKAGFYQVGGATGFRDQLQDCLAFLHSAPELVKAQILESAGHQYQEGDVMHWWHRPKFGLRTRITDDKLFLPLAVSEYLKFTSDMSILEIQIPYLDSKPLSGDERTRFEDPPRTAERASLMRHCLAAIRCALKYGEHGLLIMGSGDWNDGMDEICAEGRGESVFNSMLAYKILTDFANFCAPDIKKELLRIASELRIAINDFAFEKDRYKRLYSDEGEWLGGENSEVLSLDLLVQAFAVISGVADAERSEIVLNTAYKLVDKKAGIIKLLEPPLTKEHYLGYISAYPKGVRENGGQYTHAAIWYLYALTMIGKQDRAFELFQMINPVEKCRNAEKSRRYAGEPYVLSGDVYSNVGNYGRMGWSWYTGSAGWAYKLIIERFFGLSRAGNELVISPNLPSALDGAKVVYKYDDSVYLLEYHTGNESKIELNGEIVHGRSITLEKGRKDKIDILYSAGRG